MWVKNNYKYEKHFVSKQSKYNWEGKKCLKPKN